MAVVQHGTATQHGTESQPQHGTGSHHGTGPQPQQQHLPALMLSWLTRTQATSLWAMSFSQKVLFPLPGGPLSSSKTGIPAFALCTAASATEDAVAAAPAVAGPNSLTASGLVIAGDVAVTAGYVIFAADHAAVAAVAGDDSVTASVFTAALSVTLVAEDASVATAAVLTGFADEWDAACVSSCNL